MIYTSKPRDSFTPAIFVCLLLICVIGSASVTAQKRKLMSGSLNGLKGQKSYDLKFRYDAMLVGLDVPEEEYLAKKRRDWEMKEPSKGSAFVARWFDDRKELYEPAFIRNFEKYSKIKLNDRNAKYTLILKTYRTEGGWYAGVMGHPAEIDGEMLIVESADQNNVIAKIGFFEFAGKISYGGDFEMTNRIQSAYAITGKGLGDFVKRKAR